MNIYSDEVEKVQFEETYQKVLMKERRLKNTETGLKNQNKTRYSKTTKENSTNK